MYSHANGFSRRITMIKILLASIMMLILAAGCTSAPSETPEKFVMNFIEKHIPMIDLTVANFYVKEEQAGIIDSVRKFVALNKEKGNYESLSTATYDFSKIKIDVIDQKEEYIDDQGVIFLEVAAKGNYTKTINGETESFIEDEIIILESIAGKWQVTEQINPWK